MQELQDAVEPVLRLMQRDDVMKTVETMRDPKTLINHLTTNKEFEVKHSVPAIITITNIMTLSSTVMFTASVMLRKKKFFFALYKVRAA